MIRFYKNVWMAILFLIIFAVACPNQILSKTTTTPKTHKASQKTKTHDKTEKSQAGQTTSGSLQCDAQSAVLMDGLTGQILYEQKPNLRIPPVCLRAKLNRLSGRLYRLDRFIPLRFMKN